MKANELMIGDWVYKPKYNGDALTYIVEEVEADDLYLGRIYDFKPIPLTAEILEKNGFVHYEEDEESFHDKDCVFIKQNLGEYGVCLDKTRTTSGTFHYVHELQHALRLCGIEKEIVV